MQQSTESTLLRGTRALATPSDEERRMVPQNKHPLPDVHALAEVMELVKQAVFPDFFAKRQTNAALREYAIGVCLERLCALLTEQTARAIAADAGETTPDSPAAQPYTIRDDAEQRTRQFIDRLPEVKRLLLTDVEAMFCNDPAVSNYGEVIFCYPVMRAMTHYRVAHVLHSLGVPIIPRIITEMAHSATGIDIHPGARIGEYFSIDHGTGVVIGETCIIGAHVTLYQGVTLGAKNFALDSNGHPLNIPRHPIIEDRVTIYANSTVLGRITVGHDTIVGGNIWLTYGVPPHSRILQGKAVAVPFCDGAGI